MNKIDAPPPFDKEKPADMDWGYGTQVERPLEAGAGVENAGETGRGDEAQGQARGGGDRKPDHPSEKPTDAEARGATGDKAEAPADGAKQDERARERDGSAKPDSSEQDDKAEEEPPSPPSKLIFVVVGLLLVALLGYGAYKHWRTNDDAKETQQSNQSIVPTVRTIEAKRDDKPAPLTLPGQTEAFATASIYPRATGYITERRVDIGSRVKKGDLLIHIAAPDLDQQLAQAKAQVGQVKAAEEQAQAQVNQAEANLNLAKVTLARTNSLTQQGYETLQNRDNQVANQQSQQASVDTARAGVKVAEANTKAQLATVDRLEALAGFEDVRAPFDGIVTTRNVDQGDLVNADSSSSSAIFSLARDDVIRVTVEVPQNASAGVRDGIMAHVEVPSNPGQNFAGTVTRSSVALLSSARTLSTEVDVPNPDGRIRPGLFVYVTMDIPQDHATVAVPAEAMIFNQHGLQVAIIDDGKVKLHEVKIYRDYGATVAVSEGLNGGERVVLNPPALLHDGSKVEEKKAEDEKQDGDQPDQQKKGGDPNQATKPNQDKG